MPELECYVADEEAQMALAGRMAKACNGGLTVLLQGGLGVGKTTFVRGFLRALGYQGVVKSPTYTLVEPYQVAGKDVYHFDLYRMADAEELEYLGGRDYFETDAICLIEWPERAEGYLPRADFRLELRHESPGRRILIRAVSPRATEIVSGLTC